jgi:hypothetical protein
MKRREKSVLVADEKMLYDIPESRLLQVIENEDGTTTIAYIDVIKAKNTVENLREQISKKQIERIQWLTKSQPS